MLHKNLYLALAAALVLAPAAAQASELSRRLTIRYPGQDSKKHHHAWGFHEKRRHDDRHNYNRGNDNRGNDDRRSHDRDRNRENRRRDERPW